MCLDWVKCLGTVISCSFGLLHPTLVKPCLSIHPSFLYPRRTLRYATTLESLEKTFRNDVQLSTNITEMVSVLCELWNYLFTRHDLGKEQPPSRKSIRSSQRIQISTVQFQWYFSRVLEISMFANRKLYPYVCRTSSDIATHLLGERQTVTNKLSCTNRTFRITAWAWPQLIYTSVSIKRHSGLKICRMHDALSAGERQSLPGSITWVQSCEMDGVNRNRYGIVGHAVSRCGFRERFHNAVFCM